MIEPVRARRHRHLPTVMTQAEVEAALWTEKLNRSWRDEFVS